MRNVSEVTMTTDGIHELLSRDPLGELGESAGDTEIDTGYEGGDTGSVSLRHHRRDAVARPEKIIIRVRAALERTDRPVRARALARELGLPQAEVTAQLRRFQDVGAAASQGRRWTATPVTRASRPDGAADPARLPGGSSLPERDGRSRECRSTAPCR